MPRLLGLKPRCASFVLCTLPLENPDVSPFGETWSRHRQGEESTLDVHLEPLELDKQR